MSKVIKLANVRFNETTVLEGGRVYAYAEEGVIPEAEAKRVGSSVEVLGEARDMFQPDASEPVEVPAVEEEPATEEKDAVAPENKMVTGAPEKKSAKKK